ncbi:hypothetical protein SLS64_009879 [Diaporthe eres]|uniref:Uncharacterized protein n=1 Tax=Diaporthe eres TaxID=83184 RepID=A0ABR1NR59_DIAER
MKRRPGAISWQMVGICAGLFVTTVLSVLLLTASCSGWSVPDNIYWANIAHRASIQLVVQILSNALALVYSSALCMLINYASRIYWDKNGPVRMDTLRFWRDMCALRMDFDIPVSLMLLLVGFIGLTSVQSALWAGALTPVSTMVLRETNITVPSYHNASLIAEYASEVGADAPPDVRGTKGYFTYKVGVGLTGELLRAAASATPTGDQPRNHQKNDNTQFTYIGRSYGVGSSVGLLDDTTPSDTLALALTFKEVGYDASVSCAYNASADFVLEALGSGDIDAFAAKGELPNSVPGDPEYSTYVGWGARSVVAIGVGRDANSTRHTLGIAAGEAYAHLNATQCDISFASALFDVAVSLRGRNISVTRASTGPTNDSDAAAAPAWDTSNLRYVLTRQFELLANAQTNLYVSLVGSSLNSSIADYVTASGSVGVGLEEATPPGLANAVAVMTDDMLVAYAQAQLMVGGFVEGAPAVVQRQAMRVGEDAYVYAVFVLNVVVILAVLVECLRTKGWRSLVLFDYMDVAWLAVGGFRGGVIAANGVEDTEIDVVDGMSPEEWNRLDVSLESAANDSFIRIMKRTGG